MASVSNCARAIRLKLRMLTACDTLWPAAVRGGRLLARGRVREFARKLFSEPPAPPRPPRTGPQLFLAGHVLGFGGYDHLVLNVLKGLTAAGIDVCGDRRSCFRRHVVPPELQPTDRPRRDQPRLAVAPPYLLRRYRPDARTAAFTMWETDTLPGDAVRHLNRCGLVIVPSRWGAECMRANGVSVPVDVVPLGYDPETFTPHSRDAEWSAPVVFGTAGALDQGGLRKNVQRVIDLFRRAFPTEPGVRLKVKITPNSPRVDTRGDPRVEVADTSLTPAALADWYRSLDAYVNGSFGEGFGLHLLEAMACGVPLISTTFGGPGAFFDSGAGYEVGYRQVEARNAVYRGTWADPDDADIIDRMGRVRADRGEARRLGAAAAARALRFRWEDTTRTLVEVLTRHGFLPG